MIDEHIFKNFHISVFVSKKMWVLPRYYCLIYFTKYIKLYKILEYVLKS